ncbi:MAG TPA: hypothetical protein VK453_11410 [Micromonosporaceae bacterium]|nr:hypothetical protein [Micromonosporaceae bacterium]
MRGTYVSPEAGRTTFKQYATNWLAAATTDEGTQQRLEYELRLHVFPSLGDRPLAAIQSATIREGARRFQEAGLAPSYRRILFNDVSSIFNAAVDDKMIASNPFAVKSIRRPKYEPTRVIPRSNGQRITFRDNIRDRYRIAVDLGSGCALRQGEISAVSPDDIDPTRPYSGYADKSR